MLIVESLSHIYPPHTHKLNLESVHVLFVDLRDMVSVLKFVTLGYNL